MMLSAHPSQRALHSSLGHGYHWRRPNLVCDYLSKTGVQSLEKHISNASFTVYRPMLPIIVIGSEDGMAKVTAWVHIQLRVAQGTHVVVTRFDGGVVVTQTQPGRVQRTPRPKAHTFLYHHKNKSQRRYTAIPSYITQWALRQFCRNLYCSRVGEQGVWKWFACRAGSQS